ncbi:MAG TPA: hypothetical protein VFQ41_04780 [Candidatus Angelobacter sp.]|nr:hypothetical protein [Candidatus Angelobacter sp.]
MNCSLSTVYLWISLGIALLILAIGISYAWVAAIPLFIAAGIVATVAYYIIPKIKSALLDYATCRGTAGKCSISLSINTLGQAASTLSVVSFTLAGLMELGALALIYSWFLAWLGVSIQAAVATLVLAGQFACAITALILLGVLTNANSFKSCMDQQGAGPVILAQSRK